MSIEKKGQPEPILGLPMANNPDTPTAEEIAEVRERGGPFITIEFVSNDGMFSQSRMMNFEEAQEFYASLGAEIANAKSKYNIND